MPDMPWASSVGFEPRNRGLGFHDKETDQRTGAQLLFEGSGLLIEMKRRVVIIRCLQDRTAQIVHPKSIFPAAVS